MDIPILKKTDNHPCYADNDDKFNFHEGYIMQALKMVFDDDDAYLALIIGGYKNVHHFFDDTADENNNLAYTACEDIALMYHEIEERGKPAQVFFLSFIQEYAMHYENRYPERLGQASTMIGYVLGVIHKF